MRDERRELILSVSLQLFASRGLADTRIADIAEAAGISGGLVYHYFGSKEAIFVALVGESLTKMTASARELENLAISPRDKIKLALGGLLRDLARRDATALAYLLVAQAAAAEAVPREARRILEREQADLEATIARILEAGQKDGSVRRCEAVQLARLFWTVILGLSVQQAISSGTAHAPSVDLLLNLFVVDGPMTA